MFLKLKNICLNFIARNFFKIENFDPTLLSSAQKVAIIELLATHDLLHNENNNQIYQRNLILNFFNGHFAELLFDCCDQIDEAFLQLICQFITSADLSFTALTVKKCNKLTGLHFFAYFI